MGKNRIHLSLAKLSGTEIEYIQQTFSDNWVTTGGPHVALFENKLQTFLGDEHFVAALNSGTSSIHLGLILLSVKKDDVVICQSFTFSASANPILYQGATPIFVDSESDTWNICPIALEQAINSCMLNGKKPKAIIAVNLYGMPFKVDEILAISKKYDIPILEDSAEALGSKFKNKQCGTFGDFGVVSFNGNKIITTSAGGILVAKDKEQYDKAIFYATQSRETAPHYEHSKIGYNYRMSSVCASIGLAQMEILEKNIAKRRDNNLFYRNLIKKIPGLSMQTEPDDSYFSNFWLSTILVDAKKCGKTNTEFRLFLESQNIESRPLWKPLHMQNIFDKYPFFGLNIAKSIFEQGLCLPSGSNLNDLEKSIITNAFLNFFIK